jgi:hypothetical protein
MGLAIGVGLLMLGLFSWSLWRESGILAPRQAVLFWVLRAAALGVVLWLLLAPSNVTVETSTTRKAVVFLADVSGSMGTADGQGTSDDLRWRVANSSEGDESPVVAADKVLTDILVAERQLKQAEESIGQRQSESVLIEHTSSAGRAIARARESLRFLETRLDPSARAKVQSLLEKLDGAEWQAFDRLCNSLEKGRAPADQGWRESFSDLRLRIAGILYGLDELARVVNDAEQSELALESPEFLAEAKQSSRLSKTLAFLSRLDSTVLSSLTETADVRYSSFDNTVTRLGGLDQLKSVFGTDAPADAQSPQAVLGTNLTAALESLKQQDDQPIAAAFILTDSAHNAQADRAPQEAAARLGGIPVYVVPIGSSEHTKDVILQSVSAPKVAMRNDDIIIEAHLQTYDCADEICTVKLLKDGEVVDFREVTLDSNFAARTIRFEQKVPIIRQQQFQVSVDSIQGEFTTENNYDEFEVNVTRNEIKLLLADELPRWEYRYLAQLFRRDEKIECDELLYRPRMIATGQRETSKTLPVTLEEWNHYDVVILGDLPPEHFPVAAQESLLEYLRARGGTLVLIAGREAMPDMYRQSILNEVIPVTAAPVSNAPTNPNYAFHLTKEGSEHPALMIGESDQATQIAWDFINQFSPVQQVSPWRIPKPSARTLLSVVRRNSPDAAADAESSAFLCWQPVGRGRVVYLSGPETYRLRFLRGDQFHHRFWGQLLRWAIASDLKTGSEFVRIASDKTRYLSQETPRVTVELYDMAGKPVASEPLELHISSADHEQIVPLVPSDSIPGRYEAEIRRLPPGVYRAEPQGPAIDKLHTEGSVGEPVAASFTVQTKPPQELTETRSDRALAGQIASLTGGQVLPPTSVEEILELTDLEPLVTETIERRPLWLEWKYLWIVFGCLHTEWIIRKWKGLS